MESLVVNRDYELRERVARWLAERGVEKFELRREGDAVRVYVKGEEVAEIRAKVNKSGNVVFNVYGLLINEIGQRSKELIMKIEKGKAEPYQIRALLATDGWYNNNTIGAVTTAITQAAMYRRLGMEVYYAGYGVWTKNGPKPVLVARLPRDEGGEKWVELVKRDLENGVRVLSSDRSLRGALAGLALGLLGRIEISIKGAYGEEGRRKAAEVKRVIMERIEYFARLRLGEGGKVCLANCRFGEHMLTYKHEPYARVVAPLLHYIAENAPVEEVMKFLTHLIIYDGSVLQNKVFLTIGHFGARKEEKKLPLDTFDKITLYTILAARYGIKIKKIYIVNEFNINAKIYFDNEYIIKMFRIVRDDSYFYLPLQSDDHVAIKIRRILLKGRREHSGSSIEIVINFSIRLEKRRLIISYQPKLPETFDRAVDMLKAAGFIEDVHFTAKRPNDNQQGHIRLKIPAGLWRLVELERAGVGWAKEALDRLKEIARERGFYDLLERHLKPAEEAETLDPKKVVVEDPESGVRAVVRDLRLEWVDGRPRVIVEYEANGRVKTFYFAWNKEKKGGIYAGVNLNYVKATVLAILTGDESIKDKKQTTLTARHLFALARYKGIGWGLLRWYAEMTK